MKKTVIIVGLLAFTRFFAIGQNITQKAISVIGDRIKFSVGKNFNPDKGFQMDSCINTIVFAKFKIVDGKIDSEMFSVRSPPQIKTALQNSFNLFNKQEGQLKELKQVEGRTFLLPLIVFYEIGCTPASYVTNVSPQKSLETLLKNPDFILRDALINVMKFENGKSYSAIDCIFLNPVYFSVMQ